MKEKLWEIRTNSLCIRRNPKAGSRRFNYGNTVGTIAMKRILTVAMALVLVVSLVGMASVAVAQNNDSEEAINETAPGERLSGVIGVTDAELDGEITERSFGISVAQAATDNATAEVVNDSLNDIEERLDELEERKADLDEALANDEISQGQYNAEVATLEVERMTAERLVNQSATVAADLPDEVLEANNISVEHIETLRQQASELTGPEVAEIAKGIAGPNVGESLPDEAGDRIPVDPDTPDDNDENGTDE